MSETVAEQWCNLLVRGGFRLLYSQAGERENALTEKLRREKRFSRRVELQQESAVVAAAAAGARLTGEHTVCYAGCFPGICNACAVLLETESMQDPLLVLGVLPPGAAADSLSGAKVVERAETAVEQLAEAIKWVRDGRKTQILLLRENVAAAPAAEPLPSLRTILPALPQRPHPTAVAELAALLAASERTVFLCGHGCAGAREEILAVARRLQIPVAFTLSGKDIMEGDNELSIGMPGQLGWGAAPRALEDCDLLVLWGTDYPGSAPLPQQGNIVQVGSYPESPGQRVNLRLGVSGDMRQVALALLPLLPLQAKDDFAAAMRSLHRRELTRLETHVRCTDDTLALRPELVTRLLSDLAEPDAVFCVDTGAPLMWCARYLHPSGRQRLTASFRLGLPTIALPMGVGIKAAYPSRQVIAVCSAEGMLRYLSELQTLLREHLSLKILVYRPSPAESVRIDTGHSTVQDCPLPTLSPASQAAAMGVKSLSVNSPEKLYREMRRWLAETEASVLETVVNATRVCKNKKNV